MYFTKPICAFLFISGLFTVQTVPAQETDHKNPQPTAAEVVSQTNCPILISIRSIENTNDFQIVNYSLHNVGQKPILGYMLAGSGGGFGKLSAASSAANSRLFQPQDVRFGRFEEERANVRPESRLSLSIDYVLFADGSSWGEDRLKTSEWMIQGVAGRKAAIEYFRKLIESGDRSSLLLLLEQDILDLQVPVADSNMSETARKKFRLGFSDIFNLVRKNKDRATKRFLRNSLKQIRSSAASKIIFEMPE